MPEPLHREEIRPVTEQNHGATVESSPERHESGEQKQRSSRPAAAATDVAPASTASSADIDDSITTKDPELLLIEHILEENMSSFFKTLNKSQQLEFKETGEKAAMSIKAIIHRGAYKIKDIVSLITRWLRSLPGINKFFLEQEAKIKADKIIDLYKR